jgi:hypothetical protein
VIFAVPNPDEIATGCGAFVRGRKIYGARKRELRGGPRYAKTTATCSIMLVAHEG